jgi:hypothetical protein
MKNVYGIFETTKIARKFTIKMRDLIKLVNKMVTRVGHT